MTMPAVLEAEGLRRAYGDRVVLSIDTLQVHAGEVLAVLGPNGSGKSTLFRLLLMLEPADAGVLRFEGRPLRSQDLDLRRRMAGVFQQPYLFSGSVEGNVAYGLRARGVTAAERRQRVERALRDLGILQLAGRDVRRLSGGEAQRVALARTLVLEPDVLLLDEPTANLDVTIQRQFRVDVANVVRAHARAVLLITHDPADAFALADRVAVLQDGRIVQVAEPTVLITEPATSFVAAFTGAELLIEGMIEGDEDGLAHVRLPGGSELWAARAQVLRRGARVSVSYRPEDVAISSLQSHFESSARNVFALRVTSMTPTGGLVRLGLDGPVNLAAIITRRSAEELGISRGLEVNAHLKAAALHVFAGMET
jgi:molybdopterin-binding protein